MAEMPELSVTISVKDVPELLAVMRCELASIVREVADAEASPHVAMRLREIAVVFETGQHEDLDG